MLRFALTIFLSAFLLFQVQPIVGKYILPWYGGGAGVWTVCLLFFQLTLLLGYLYAHLIRSRRHHQWIHLGLMALSLVLVPIRPHHTELFAGPTGNILVLLALSVGLPFLVVSSTAPLLQSWFARSHPERSPYRLYSLSNLGSLLALLSYPVLMEPHLSRDGQVWSWSGGYALFVLLMGWCAVKLPPPSTTATVTDDDVPPPVALLAVAKWLVLSAAASAMLLATTSQLTQEVPAVPFLWVLPLSIYLLSFIICFDHSRWYDRRVFGPLLVASVVGTLHLLDQGLYGGLEIQLFTYGALLFACCMTCHGELVRSKPHPSRLTLFYLVVAVGGAMGGLFVALVAPRVFDGYWEFHIALAACCFLALLSWFPGSEGTWFRPLWWLLALGLLVLVGALFHDVRGFDKTVIRAGRNFYGVLRVKESGNLRGDLIRRLFHGRSKHGTQFWNPGKRRWRTTYYSDDSGSGLALKYHPTRPKALDVGVVGLGTGSVANLARRGDRVRFYEINPLVGQIARENFSYLADSPASVELVFGDGRVRLEQEAARGQIGRYDVLVIDAFTSESIPIHLLTAECFDLYWKVLRRDGLLTLLISSRFVDLEPVILGHARARGKKVILVRTRRSRRQGTKAVRWVVLGDPDNPFFQETDVARRNRPIAKPPLVWTDRSAALWPLLRWER